MHAPATCPYSASMHYALLALFGSESEVLRMYCLHLHRNANYTIASWTKHIPLTFVLNVVQKIFLIVDFELQFLELPSTSNFVMKDWGAEAPR
jgi:hypothetical protein